MMACVIWVGGAEILVTRWVGIGAKNLCEGQRPLETEEVVQLQGVARCGGGGSAEIRNLMIGNGAFSRRDTIFRY